MDRWELTATFNQFGVDFKRRWTFRRKHDADDHLRVIQKHKTFITANLIRI